MSIVPELRHWMAGGLLGVVAAAPTGMPAADASNDAPAGVEVLPPVAADPYGKGSAAAVLELKYQRELAHKTNATGKRRFGAEGCRRC